ncbi:hypothetical protein DFV33_04735 [Salmonella enterica subsp. enterica serovar Bareilly]|nr:hypothetical protein [Salmonella enterica subsp. enterica serovar Bareilly]
MSKDEGKFLRSALERLRVDGASVDALAAAFGFTLPASVEATYPVLRPILPPEEKEAFVRYLLRMGYQSTSVDITPSTDGLNHFNIYSQGRTEIGRMASNFYARPGEYFVTPHGPFRTLEGYYHYLRILDYLMREIDNRTLVMEFDIMRQAVNTWPDIEKLRALDGTDCIRLGRNLKAEIYGGTSYKPGSFTPVTESRFIHALVNKLFILSVDGTSLGNVFAEILRARIPLKHYYTMQGRKIFPAHWDWLPNLIEMIAEHIDPEDSTFDRAELLKKLGIDDGTI